MSAERLLVYTCIAGDYDTLRPPRIVAPGVDYVCLSDRPVELPSPWQLRLLAPLQADPRALNRYAKMHPHLLFPDHAQSVYVDGNIELVGDPRALVSQALAQHDMAIYRHPFRDCIYQEAQTCAAIGHDWLWTIRRQMRRYAADGYPANHGLFEAGVIVRQHGSAALGQLMAAWFAEYEAGVRRDQLSLPYLAWKQSFGLHDLGPSDPRFGRTCFLLHVDHKRPVRKRTLLRGKINQLLGAVFRWRMAPAGAAQGR